jgi:RbcX protein
MDLKQIAKDTSKTVISYLTYQAMRTVLAQLSETDPPQALWLHQFSSREKIQDGETYLQALFQERQALAFRILTVREHLASEICDFLPEMVRTGIQQANMQRRAEQLERVTQLDVAIPSNHPDYQSGADDSGVS